MEKKCVQLLEKLEYFKFSNRKNFHKLQIAHIQIETRKEDFEAGKLDTDYFNRKLKDFQKEIQAFEETAAPAGHSLLWDDTDKTYGYVNNYTGEVTFKYPTTYQKPKKVEVVEKSGKSESSADKLPWKYTSDGSITGTLGGEKKKPVGTSGQSALVSQTDILKDKLTLERVKPPKNNFQASPKINIGRPIKNEKMDPRLARLGIQIEEPEPEKLVEPVLDEKESNGKSSDPPEPKFHAEEGNMEISDEEDDDSRRDSKKKKRKKEKNKKAPKSNLGMLEKWKARQENEQTSLWSQLGI